MMSQVNSCLSLSVCIAVMLAMNSRTEEPHLPDGPLKREAAWESEALAEPIQKQRSSHHRLDGSLALP